ncbi:MAG: valine--tRNA ligase, partial [Candidatus Margulisiibacteriota bacterium]
MTTRDIPKTYDPSAVEQKWYKFWEENKLFTPDEGSKAEPFTIVIPPPNVTGALHMGHAIDNTIQDILIRWKRMQGFNTLWVPGTDHAGIATQNVVEKQLRSEGTSKDDLGREEFVNRVWKWKEEYGSRITTQLRRLGASCDWTRERFTMDEGLSKAVRREFVTLYKEGLIYRGKRIINWCPRCGTALSDIEVEYKAKKGKLWHLKYPLDEASRFVVVATTRPETMLGDTAVAINPKDDRYKHMFGKELTLPLVGRKIPIIKDDFVDMKFGTGAVKVTPAHDPNDYEMGERHNLPKINVLTPDAKITLNEFEEQERVSLETGHGLSLQGLDRFKARKMIVEALEKEGYLVKVEDYENSVGHCYRCKEVVEPYLSDQWFVKIKPLAEEGIRAVEEGHVKFEPERWTKVYLQWMTNLKDWCISRQLWWGHQVPVWYCEACGETVVSEETPAECPKCKSKRLRQDPDVFDTWFSSALWPFSTLGWPEETKDLITYYPTSVLVTGYDIITFWVSRMIMTGMHFMKKEPFHTVFIHGLIRDITGKKMSKSLGNVIDPINVIDKTGADSLRFALVSLITGQGQDIKLAEEKIIEARNFANKIWNVSRFVLTEIDRRRKIDFPPSMELCDKWILSRLNKRIDQVTDLLSTYDFGEAARVLYEFIWSEFCDWYIELSKLHKEEKMGLLMHVLQNIVKLLHPFMPFETEEIWQMMLPEDKQSKPEHSLMSQSWPAADKAMIDEKAEAEMEKQMEIIRAIRNIRAEMGIPYSKAIKVILVTGGKVDQSYIRSLTKAGEISIVRPRDLAAAPEKSATALAGGVEIHIPLAGLIDFDKEKARLEKELSKVEADLEKTKQKLANENF